MRYTLAQLNMFTENLTAGRGFIAHGGDFRSLASAGSYDCNLTTRHGGCALQLRLQGLGSTQLYQFLLMLYIFTILAMVGVAKSTNALTALAAL